jgi:hypothetical protein
MPATSWIPLQPPLELDLSWIRGGGWTSCVGVYPPKQLLFQSPQSPPSPPHRMLLQGEQVLGKRKRSAAARAPTRPAELGDELIWGDKKVWSIVKVGNSTNIRRRISEMIPSLKTIPSPTCIGGRPIEHVISLRTILYSKSHC